MLDKLTENKPYHVECGNSLEKLKELPDTSIDSIVTDAPYELGFMGKKWDSSGIAYNVDLWKECLRVLKPGAHVLAFSGSRTYHRMACAIEDAGFEIRDQIMWTYGSGFPKSADVSKQIDQQEKNRWIKISKAIDNANPSEIAELWINSKNANAAGLSFQRKQTEAGLNTQKNGFAHGSVLLQASHKSCDALAVIAELNLIEAHPTSAVICSSAQPNVESSITALRSHANTAGSSQENHEATRCMVDFSALQSAWGWQDESKADKLKAVEALKTWLGSKQSSRQEATSALCAALTDDLKLITLSQSKTFLSFDTTRQTVCASAISATITESTAESLISFTVDTLRSKAIDKAAGAERDVVGQGVSGATAGMKALGPSGIKGGVYDITAPATDAAKQWQGWGSALKPAHEPICMARKPLIGTIAENVLTHGTGALNIDGCRVPYVTVGDGNLALNPHLRSHINGGNGGNIIAHEDNRRVVTPDQAGRFPANLIHDGSDDVLDNFPDSLGSGGSLPNVKVTGYGNIIGTGKSEYLGGERTKVDSGTGSAARFFYCAKASKADRNAGLGEGETNTHVTVKPVSLMSYLCRLITPPNGIVLDPFNGSGSTGKGAMLENFRYLGIDLSDEYVKISEARIKYAFENKEKLKADLEKKSKATSEKPDVPKSNTGANTLAHLFSTSKEVTP